MSISTAVYELHGTNPERGVIKDIKVDLEPDNLKNGADPY